MVSVKRLLQFSPPPLSLTRFSQGLFVALQEIAYQTSFALIRFLQKIMHFFFFFSFNLLLADFGFSAFCVCFLVGAFSHL